MAEEGQVGLTGTPEGEPAPSLVGTDGVFNEGWQGMLDEDIRDEKCLSTVKDVRGMVRSYVHAQKMIGKDKIGIPNDASSESEWEEYHIAGGRPSTAEDYNLTRPEELPEEVYNQDLATAAQSLFHKIGLSQKQADALFQFNNNNVISALTKQTQDNELAMSELVNGLKTEWGQAYDQKVHLGNVAVEHGCGSDSEFKERLTQKFGDDPDFIKCLANLGAKFAEASPVKSEMIPTPADLKERIEEESRHPAYGLDYLKHGFTKQQHQAQTDKVYQMRLAMTPNVEPGKPTGPV